MNLQQIKKDRENGVLLGTVTIDKLVEYALQLEQDKRNLEYALQIEKMPENPDSLAVLDRINNGEQP